jgi:hypothetical protein
MVLFAPLLKQHSRQLWTRFVRNLFLASRSGHMGSIRLDRENTHVWHATTLTMGVYLPPPLQVQEAHLRRRTRLQAPRLLVGIGNG